MHRRDARYCHLWRLSQHGRLRSEEPVASKRDRELMGLVNNVVTGELDRRDFVRRMTGLSAGAIFGGSLAGLIASRDASAAPAGTRARTTARYQDPAPVKGGTVVAATIDKPVNMDPAFAQLY